GLERLDRGADLRSHAPKLGDLVVRGVVDAPQQAGVLLPALVLPFQLFGELRAQLLALSVLHHVSERLRAPRGATEPPDLGQDGRVGDGEGVTAGGAYPLAVVLIETA